MSNHKNDSQQKKKLNIEFVEIDQLPVVKKLRLSPCPCGDCSGGEGSGGEQF